ncbi:hypothetical protein [Deinococcus misasensis]|uniref:hypothetical protein n=1 Tax=Deinococcus misasensis TaxID=392413 RepID=UPI0005554BD5|nr:hypothetical protein [Deinococcus misasensis]
MQRDLLALTVSPPWGFAILHLGKNVENRDWFPERHGMRQGEPFLRPGDWFLIHGGRSPFTAKRGDIQETDYGHEFRVAIRLLSIDFNSGKMPQEHINKEYLKSISTPLEDGYELDYAHFHLPGLIGAVEYLGYRKGYESYWSNGRSKFQWLLGRKVVFPEAIEVKGAPKLWQVPDDLRLQAREQFRLGRQSLKGSP